VANRDAARLLYRAIQDSNGPEGCQRKFRDLLAADERTVHAYGNLAVAFATSLQLTHYIKQPHALTMLESFRYYTDSNNAFRQDLKTLPYEFSRFLADTRLSIADRRWAQKHYAHVDDLPICYFDVHYDEDYFFHGKPKKISRAEYTLENLKRLGGICIDEAYFASELCKAMGLPASIIHGHSAEGGPHAWLAVLKIQVAADGAHAEWDANTARYAEHKYYTGTLINPADGNWIHDSELALLGWAAGLKMDQREEADAATALAAMAAQAVRTPPAELPPGARIEPAMVEALLFEAANRNLAHRRTWELIIQLRKAGELSTECLDRLFDFLVNRTSKEFPDYACSIMLQIVPTYEPDRREKIYRRGIELYSLRPDLQGRLKIALGDDYKDQGKMDQALKSYQSVYTSPPMRELTELLVLAVRHAGDLLVADNRRGEAIELYRKLFSESNKPERNGAYHQTAYYLLGRRLAELLQDDSQADAAKQVLQKIGEGPLTEKT
jgi:tetratricopeptide (TPR) repeat protein